MTATDYVIHLLHEQYAKQDSANQVSISPAQLADTVYQLLDPACIEWLAILELRQLARNECAKQHAEAEAEIETQQDDLFEYKLQARYPARRGEDDIYVLRDELTATEAYANYDRLRREARTKNRHADALLAWIRRKFGFEPGEGTVTNATV